MSALTPHIRVLHAEAVALSCEAKSLDADTPQQIAAAFVLLGIASAKIEAANQLEAEEAALKPPREGLDEEITYNPKGKPKS